MNSQDFQERLAGRARNAGVEVPPALGERFEAYFRLLATWNQKINLTALQLVDPPPETFDRLLIEPLAAARYVPESARRMMDIGSGGGSPAIPLALAAPQLQLLMVESKTRKSVFLREAIRALGLQGADVAIARFEELLVRPSLRDSHDLVTVRAVRTAPDVLSNLKGFLRPGGLLFLFRGRGKDEAETLSPELTWKATHLLSGESQLVVMESVGG